MTCSSEVGVGRGGGDIRLETVFFSEVGVGRGGRGYPSRNRVLLMCFLHEHCG